MDGVNETLRPWARTEDELPPESVVVETEIRDAKGERNVYPLYRIGNLWFEGGSYVYYTPTHWRPVEGKK